MVSRSAATSAIDPQSDPTQKALAALACVSSGLRYWNHGLPVLSSLPACLRVAYRLAMLKHVARIWMLAVFGQNVPSQVRGDAERCRALCLICTFRTMRDAMGVSPPDGRTPNAALFLPSAPKVPRVWEISVQCGCFAGQRGPPPPS